MTTLVMLALLIWLGNWQVQRLAWKTDLLAQIDRAEAAPGIPLPPDPSPFAKVAVAGRFMDRSARYASEVHDTPAGPRLGAQLVTPLQRDGAEPVLVDRGWVPDGAAVPAPAGPVTVEGFVHPAETPGWLSARDDPAGRHFYTLDPPAIGAALGLARVAPFTLVAMGRPGAIPEPAQHLPRPPNDHLSYAVTWFGLAVTLLVIFSLYARKALRR